MVSHAHHHQPSTTAVPEGRTFIPYLTPMMASIGGSEKKRPHWVRHLVVHNSNKQSIIIVSDYEQGDAGRGAQPRNDGESSRMMGTTTSTDKNMDDRTSSTLTFRTVSIGPYRVNTTTIHHQPSSSIQEVLCGNNSGDTTMSTTWDTIVIIIIIKYIMMGAFGTGTSLVVPHSGTGYFFPSIARKIFSIIPDQDSSIVGRSLTADQSVSGLLILGVVGRTVVPSTILSGFWNDIHPFSLWSIIVVSYVSSRSFIIHLCVFFVFLFFSPKTLNTPLFLPVEVKCGGWIGGLWFPSLSPWPSNLCSVCHRRTICTAPVLLMIADQLLLAT